MFKVPDPAGPYGLGEWRYRLDICPCRKEADIQRFWRNARASSNLTPAMERMTFGAFHERSETQAAYVALRSFVDAPRKWITLIGPPGTGKTHLLVATAQALLNQAKPALYIIAPSFLDYLRRSFDQATRSPNDDAQARLQRIEQTHILLLDDLGAEKQSDWAQERMFLLLDYRYRNKLPTIIASNLHLSQLPMRIADRIADTSLDQIFEIVANSYRRTTR